MRLFSAFYLTLFAALLMVGFANSDVSARSTLINLELQNTSVVEGIKALFEGSGYRYSIDPGITGKIIELTIKGFTFDQALKEFASAADFTYTVDNGNYVIRPAKVSVVSVPGRTIFARGTAPQLPVAQPEYPPPMPTPTQVVVTQNAPVVYSQQVTPMGGGYGGNGYGGGYYPPYYQAGNLRIASGWPPYNLTSDNPYILNVGYPPPPPPPGWLPYGMERFLRAANALALRPYFTTAY